MALIASSQGRTIPDYARAVPALVEAAGPVTWHRRAQAIRKRLNSEGPLLFEAQAYRHWPELALDWAYRHIRRAGEFNPLLLLRDPGSKIVQPPSLLDNFSPVTGPLEFAHRISKIVPSLSVGERNQLHGRLRHSLKDKLGLHPLRVESQLMDRYLLSGCNVELLGFLSDGSSVPDLRVHLDDELGEVEAKFVSLDRLGLLALSENKMLMNRILELLFEHEIPLPKKIVTLSFSGVQRLSERTIEELAKVTAGFVAGGKRSLSASGVDLALNDPEPDDPADPHMIARIRGLFETNVAYGDESAWIIIGMPMREEQIPRKVQRFLELFKHAARQLSSRRPGQVFLEDEHHHWGSLFLSAMIATFDRMLYEEGRNKPLLHSIQYGFNPPPRGVGCTAVIKNPHRSDEAFFAPFESGDDPVVFDRQVGELRVADEVVPVDWGVGDLIAIDKCLWSIWKAGKGIRLPKYNWIDYIPPNLLP